MQLQLHLHHKSQLFARLEGTQPGARVEEGVMVRLIWLSASRVQRTELPCPTRAAVQRERYATPVHHVFAVIYSFIGNGAIRAGRRRHGRNRRALSLDKLTNSHPREAVRDRQLMKMWLTSRPSPNGPRTSAEAKNVRWYLSDGVWASAPAIPKSAVKK